MNAATSSPRQHNPTVTASLIVIGNEILSGRTQDLNLKHLATKLAERGIRLREARMIQDDSATIQNTLNELRQTDTYVFTTGGIGPTHDDITADCVAAAFGVELLVHKQAFATLQRYYRSRDIEFNTARQRMARIPQGASLIDNPVSVAPGFRLHNVFVLAGVPKIMQAMLDNCLEQLRQGQIMHSSSLICDLPEGQLAGALGQQQQQFPDVEIGCYPGNFGPQSRVNIVLRSTNEDSLSQATTAVVNVIGSLGGNLLEDPHS